MYGIQINTTDGVKTNLNFYAGRFIGTATVSLSQPSTTYSVTMPSGVDLNDDVVFCKDYYLLQNINSAILINTGANTLSVRTPANVAFPNPVDIDFLFIRFQ